MALFGRKKEDELSATPVPASTGIPVDQITSMRNQGYTNNQIIQAIQRDGYTSQQIFDAMKQADLSSTVGSPVPGEAAATEEMPVSAVEHYEPEADSAVPEPGEPMPEQIPLPPMGAPPAMDERIDSERIEQIAEAIIDEKWEDIAKNINKIIEWKDTVELKIHDIETKFTKMKEDFDRLHNSLLGKIGEYDQNILNVGTEIKAMEKVFQKILPTLTEDVSKLTKVTEKMKKI